MAATPEGSSAPIGRHAPTYCTNDLSSRPYDPSTEQILLPHRPRLTPRTPQYATALLLILFTTLTLGQSFTISLLLDWRRIRGDTTLGWVIGFCFVLTGFITYVLSLPTTYRSLLFELPLTGHSVIPTLLLTRQLPSSLIPDFSLTLHVFHLLTTSFYAHAIPTNLLWWGLQAVSAGLMVLCGVWGVRWREVQNLREFGRKANEAVTRGGVEGGGIEMEERGLAGGGGQEAG